MNTVCPECQSPYPPGRLAGLCPGCFLAVADGVSGASVGSVDETIKTVSEASQAGGLTLPGFVVAGELARGGMGIVYRAEQLEPRRKVAIKILKPQLAGNEPVVERFRREAQSLASLDCPDILPVYSVGLSDGLPWFAMKFAAGGSLAARLPSYRGQWTRAAELMVRMSLATAFAHERGVLHRDIKPGNILFDDQAKAYLADFGLAKHLAAEATDHPLTLEADVLGTPNYLAPELASGSARVATTASDIYSLGAVLYELLTGAPPHRAENLPALLRQVADEPPRPLDQVDPVPPRDLRCICEQAMAREPSRRYASARALAEDLQRYLAGEGILARPATLRESLWRWCRQQPAVAALLAVVVLLLVALTTGSTMAALRIAQAERAARADRDRVEAFARRIMLAEAEGARRARFPDFRKHALDRVLEAGSPGESAEIHLRRRSEAVAALAFPTLDPHPLPLAGEGWTLAAVSPGHSYLAWTKLGVPGWRVTRVRDGKVVSQSSSGGTPLHLSQNGEWLAAAVTYKDWELWDISQSGARRERTWQGGPEDLSDDGQLVASYRWVRPGLVLAEVRETRGGKLRFELEFPDVTLKMRFSPNGTLCALAPSFYANDSDFPYSVRAHSCVDGRLEREFSPGMANCIWAMAWSRDGSHLAASERGGVTRIWDTHSGNTRHVLTGAGAGLWRLAFSEDNRYVAGISDDFLLTIFDLVSGLPVARGPGWYSHALPLLTWSTTEAGVLGPVMVEGQSRFFRMKPGVFSTFSSPDSHGSALGVAVSSQGRWLAVGDSRHARLWDLSAQRLVGTFANGLWNSFVFSPDDRWLYGAGEPGATRWRMDGDGIVRSTRTDLLGWGRHNLVVLADQGRQLAVANEGEGVTSLFALPATAQPVRHDIPNQEMWVALSPDGKILAALGESGLRICRVPGGEKLFEDTEPGQWASFSADGQWLLVGRLASSANIRYEIRAASDWHLVLVLPGEPTGPDAARAAFGADGRWLATGHAFGRIALWRVGIWEPIAILESPNRQPVGRLAFTADATRLFSASTGGVVEAWDLGRLEKELQGLGLAW